MAVNTQQNNSSGIIDNAGLTYKPLLHELQLGEQLNECVHSTRRADFSLMLAMLAEDVREQSQFVLPQAEAIKNADISNEALRKEFELPEKAPLSLRDMDEIDSFNQAKHFKNNDLATIYLTNAISPNPLAFRDNVKHIPTQVMDNTSVYCQLKHAKQQDENTPLNKPLAFNAKAWLNTIQNTLVTAPLITC